jgi:hypothetical protein
MSDNALNVYAFQDAIDLLNDYLGQNAAGVTTREMNRAVIQAYDELCAEKKWSHLTRPYSLELPAPESGTLSYNATTGVFTIDTGTFPSWAVGATLSVGDVRYPIATRPSTTTLTPVSTNLPVDDIDTGTTFSIYKNIYTLPENFQSLVNPLDEANISEWSCYVPPDEWEFYNRYDESQGSPVLWTIMADPNFLGRDALHLWPAPDSNRTLEFLGRFYPRGLKRTGYRAADYAGTVSLSGNTITGTSTTFTSDMVGSLIRVSANATTAPDGIDGNNPYETQRIITAYSSATSLTFGGDAVSASTRKYRITDPLDVPRHMLDAVWRGCERKVAHLKGTSEQDRAEVTYSNALRKAKSSDTRNPNARQSCWDSRPIRTEWRQGEDDF